MMHRGLAEKFVRVGPADLGMSLNFTLAGSAGPVAANHGSRSPLLAGQGNSSAKYVLVAKKQRRITGLKGSRGLESIPHPR